MNFADYDNHLPYPQFKSSVVPSTAADRRAERAAYRAENTRLEVQFKADLEAEFGVIGNPKADKCFSLAWDYGHSSGYREVYSYYSELVELIKG